MNYLTQLFGFKDAAHFLDSAFHFKNLVLTLNFSITLATISLFVEKYFGFNLIVFVVIIILFTTEIVTGTKASVKEGKPITSKEMPKGYIKLFVYFIPIISAHLLAVNMPINNVFGYETSVYEWLHLATLHFVILNLFISLFENFARLGWDEFVPLIKHINKILKIDPKKSTPDENI